MQQITIAWQDDMIVVQTDQGQEQVDDIGAALQMVLDAYKATDSEPGQADYMAAFTKPERKSHDKEPSMSDKASAARY